MDEIHLQASKAIEDQRTIRVVVDVPTELLRSEDYLASASDLVKPLITQWEKENMTRLLVVDAYPRHTFVVIDINNYQYDFDTAHKQKFAIPVYILRLFKGGNKWAFFRRPVEDRRVAEKLAVLHWCNDQNPTPFFADHINGSVYLSHRMT